MNRPLKVFAIIAGVFLVLGIIASVAAQIYLAPFVKKQIEEKGSQALGSPLKVRDLSIGLFPPLTANASSVEFEIREQGVRAHIGRLLFYAQVGFSLNWKKAIQDIKIQVIEPEITYELNTKVKKQDEAPSQATTELSQGLAQQKQMLEDFEVELKIKKAKINILENGENKYLIDPLNLDLELNGFSKPISLQLELEVLASSLLAQKIPVRLHSELTTDLTQIATQNASLDIAGLQAKLSGAMNLGTLSGEWRVFSENLSYSASNSLVDLSLKGPVNGQIDATVALLNATPQLKAFNLALDLTQTELSYKKLFQKPARVILKVNASGSSTSEALELSRAQFNFDQLAAQFPGSIALPTAKQKQSKINFTLARTSLSGWEKFLPSMSQTPVTGFIEAAGVLTGNFENPDSIQATLGPIRLEQIRGSVNWTSEDKLKSAVGAVALDGKAHLAFSGQNIQTAKADLFIDLSRLAISAKDSFTKPSNLPLKLEVHASQSAKGIELKNTSASLGSNSLSLSGTLQDPAKPKLNFQFHAPKLSLSELSSILLALKPYGLSGQANSSGKISGVYDFKLGYEKSPLSLSADLTANLPSLNCPSDPNEGKAKPVPQTAAAQAPPSEPMLPNWPVVRNAVIKTNVKIGKLNCKKIDMQNVSWNGLLNRGVLTGNASIQKIFDGKLDVGSLKTNLAQAQPDTEAIVKTQGIDINKAITWFSPQWKDMVKGQLYGTNTVFAPDSSRADFLAKTRVQGSVELKNAFISTLQLDEMINEKLSKIPGLGNKETVRSKGVAANVKAEYLFLKSVMNLKSFHFLSPERNEIQASGTIGLDQNANLSGTAYLATAPVGGSIKAANSDASGRLVLPFELKGNLMSPNVSFAEKTIQKLAENTAKKELDNLKSKAQEQGKKELEKKFEELKKKGLKGLFGK